MKWFGIFFRCFSSSGRKSRDQTEEQIRSRSDSCTRTNKEYRKLAEALVHQAMIRAAFFTDRRLRNTPATTTGHPVAPGNPVDVDEELKAARQRRKEVQDRVKAERLCLVTRGLPDLTRQYIKECDEKRLNDSRSTSAAMRLRRRRARRERRRQVDALMMGQLAATAAILSIV